MLPRAHRACAPLPSVPRRAVSVRSVTVSVAGQRLHLRTDASDDELREVTSLVDERVRQLVESARTATSSRVYLLAALTFADELRRSKRDHEQLRSAVHDATNEALTCLDDDAPAE